MDPTNSQQALAALQQYQATAKNPADILATQNQQLGVGAAQQNVMGLRGAVANTTRLLNNVAPSVMGRTAGSLVTSAQAGRQVANESQPIAANLTSQGNTLATAQQDYQMLQDQANQAADLEYQGQQGKLSYMQNLYNTMYQKEQDDRAAAEAEADRQEQIRQFNATLAKSGSSGSGGSASPSITLSGGSAAAAPPSQTQATEAQKTAYNKAKSLIDTKDANRIKTSYLAIQKSAGYGNALDKMILSFLNDTFGLAGKYAPLPGLGAVAKANPYPTTATGSASSMGLGLAGQIGGK